MPIGPFICDFLCRSRNLVVELDGASHDMSIETDVTRSQWLQDQGYTVIRFANSANSDVFNNVEGVIRSIEIALATLPTPGPSRKREGS
jgi:very-short-patch-repair endonuclease